MASEACDALLLVIKASQLDFIIQETPYSSFITIRKKFQKGFNLSEVTKSITAKAKDQKLEEANLENRKLREVIKECEAQLESVKEDSIILQAKLGKAEKDIVKLKEENIKEKERFVEEVSILKNQIKGKSDEILLHKADAMKVGKTVKSLEKEVHNYEKKIVDMETKIETINASKAEIKKERDKLLKDVKNLSKNYKKSHILKNLATQTEAVSQDESENNNLTPKHAEVISKSSQGSTTDSSASIITFSTASQTSSSPPEVSCSVIGEPSPQIKTFNCVICNETFPNVHTLQAHVQSEHDLMLHSDKLIDNNEPDPFVRFVKSMEVDDEYIEDRIKFYPSHWDHLEERVKIRKLAQIKLTITSKRIEENMEKNDIKKIKFYGWSYDSNNIQIVIGNPPLDFIISCNYCQTTDIPSLSGGEWIRKELKYK